MTASAFGTSAANRRVERRVDVSGTEARHVHEYLRDRVAAGSEVYLERKGSRTFVVASE